MKKIALFAALGAVMLIVSGRAYAQSEPAEQASEDENYSPAFEWITTPPPSWPWSELPSVQLEQIAIEAQPYTSQIEITEQIMQNQRNIKAFLSAISKAEGTDKSADPYRVCYGYKHTINSLHDHPAITGEWRGEKLSDAHCKGAGLSSGCVSTAAGRYQIIKPTWVRVKASEGLPDFSAESQDKACIALIRGRGALADVEAGRFAQAVEKCRKEWASLPGAGYGQGERSLSFLQAAYTQAGGAIA